jgi:hypothetical protein
MKAVCARSVAAFLTMLITTAASSADTGERASVPPGQSRDGAGPSEGAIVGGSTAPKAAPGAAPSAAQPGERASGRCKELKGTLRDQCLRDLEGKKPLGQDNGSQNALGERDPNRPAVESKQRQ